MPNRIFQEEDGDGKSIVTFHVDDILASVKEFCNRSMLINALRTQASSDKFMILG